jgi:hypothetical protein
MLGGRRRLRRTGPERTLSFMNMNELDPALFDDAAIPAETHQVNATIIELTKDMPNWWDVGITPVAHIWVRSAQPWVQIPADAVVFDGQPSDERALVRAWRAKHDE